MSAHNLVYVPGVFRCAKCGFRVVQSDLNARDGTVTARDEPGEKCPNDGAPLWRVTYRDDLAEAHEQWEVQVKRAAEAEAKLSDAYSALRSIAEGNLGDLPWQANYVTIKQVARNALPEEMRR